MMFKNLIKLAGVIICSLMFIFTANRANAQVVTNGSFESSDIGTVTGNDIDGWVLVVDSSVSSAPDFEIIDNEAQHGSRALKVVIEAVGSKSWDIQVVADSMQVQAEQAYRYSIWAKTDQPGARVQFSISNYESADYAVVGPDTLSNEWQEFSIGFVISDQQTFIKSPIHLSFAANAGATIYLDNLRLDAPRSAWAGPPYATGKSKFLGCTYSNAQAQNFERYWSQVTPENAGKWGSAEPSRDNMNWGGLDAAYNFAKDNGFPFRYHVLIWGNQQPGWIENLPADEQLEEIEEWFTAVAERYPDIDYLEVVNEPLHDPPNQPGNGGGNYIEALGGSNGLYGTGWDWIIKSFELAREIFPDSVKLMINDYSIVNSNSSTTNYLNIINLLMERELIDGIGFQGHAFSTRGSTTTMANNLDRLAETGLPIQVTEMDIDGPTDQVQLDDYQRIYPTFWDHPAVEGITLWGWRRGLWRDAQGAYLVDDRGADRPAMKWLRDYVLSSTITSVDETFAEVPDEYYLSDNYPNPFNPSTRIAYSIPQSGFISLKVYNMLGQEVATLIEGVQSAGDYVVSFDGSGLAGGVYFYQIRVKNFVETKKLLLLK